MTDTETPVALTGDFEQSLRQLLTAASIFLLRAQDLNHAQQPEYARIFGKAIIEGGQLAVKVVIGESPLLEAAVVHGGEWHPFLRWPATPSTAPTSMSVN